jgi:hypothetical protein
MRLPLELRALQLFMSTCRHGTQVEMFLKGVEEAAERLLLTDGTQQRAPYSREGSRGYSGGTGTAAAGRAAAAASDPSAGQPVVKMEGASPGALEGEEAQQEGEEQQTSVVYVPLPV